MPLDGPQLAQQGAVFNKNFFEDFKVRESSDAMGPGSGSEGMSAPSGFCLCSFLVCLGPTDVRRAVEKQGREYGQAG